MEQEPEFHLKHTSVSRPHLSHSESQLSIAASQAASEGYYSASEVTSSSDAQKPSRYHTPPSHTRTPAESHEREHNAESSIPFIPSLRGVGVPRQHHNHNHSATGERPVSTIAEERPEAQDGSPLLRRVDMDSESVVTTPGQDTTPYIRFAIDQLTRDEEVRGSRMYPLEQEGQPQQTKEEEDDASEEEDYPVERIVSGDSLGYMRQEQRTQERLSQYQPVRQSRHTPVRNANSPPRGHNNHTPTPARETKNVFVAHNEPLDFIPSILRPIWLGFFTLLCILMLGALVFCAVYSNRTGFWDYQVLGDNRYFVFEYLPTLLGAILYLWLLQVQIALQRVVPFISMASSQYRQRQEAVLLQLYPMQFLCPSLEYFRARQPLIGTCYLSFWLFSWTIPLLACTFNVRYEADSSVWRWVAVQGVIWTVIVLYILLVLALLTLFVFLRNKTGLKWDPRSLADIIVLLERSNVVNEYVGSEMFEKKDWDCLKDRAGKIGVWSTTNQPDVLFHGFGEEGASVRKYSVEEGSIRETTTERESSVPSAVRKDHRRSDYSIRMDMREPTVRHRYLPWYLRDSSVIAWIVSALVLYIAFLVVSFVNNRVRLGFSPQVNAHTDTAGFSASNFLYSFVPALIGHLLFLGILTFDYSLRALQPYMSLSTPGGATAETSLLVDYSSRLPLSVTISALANGHYRTAFVSFVSLCSVTLPILAGGCFWTQYYPEDNLVRIAGSMPGYYALCIFLTLYVIGIVALGPGRRLAALPHRSNSLAEIISWVYQSRILSDRAFNRPQSKPELVGKLMGSSNQDRTWTQSLTSLIRPSRDNLAEVAEKKKLSVDTRDSQVDPGKIRYGFGIHVGRDGLEHLGIDQVKRSGASGLEMVISEEQNRKSWIGSLV